MPLYVYSNGMREIERFFHSMPPPQIHQDGEFWDRQEMTRFAAVGLKPEPSMGDEILRGYREQEIIHGSRFRTRRPAELIKSVWQDDKPDPNPM